MWPSSIVSSLDLFKQKWVQILSNLGEKTVHLLRSWWVSFCDNCLSSLKPPTRCTSSLAKRWNSGQRPARHSNSVQWFCLERWFSASVNPPHSTAALPGLFRAVTHTQETCVAPWGKQWGCQGQASFWRPCPGTPMAKWIYIITNMMMPWCSEWGTLLWKISHLFTHPKQERPPRASSMPSPKRNRGGGVGRKDSLRSLWLLCAGTEVDLPQSSPPNAHLSWREEWSCPPHREGNWVSVESTSLSTVSLWKLATWDRTQCSCS